MVASAASLVAPEDNSTAAGHKHSPVGMSSASAAMVPPLRLRPASSLPGFRGNAVSPSQHSSSSFTTDEEDAERRNATALTIVELLARAGGRQDAQERGQPLKTDARRSPPTPVMVAPRPVLPSLPKMKVAPAPALHTDSAWFLPAPNSFFGMMAAHSAADKAPGMPMLAAQPAGTVAVGASAPPAVVNNSRKRQKDELTRLRAQVQELQRELDHVRGRLPHKQPLMRYTTASGGVSSTPAASTGSAGSASATGGGAAVPSVPVWERMAQHQKEEKSKAEMENLRLKGLIQEQVKISRGLEKLLKKRCKNMAENPFPEKRSRECDVSESVLFGSLLSSVDARVHELDTVFKKSGMAEDKRELQETQMILDERRGPVMEVKDAKILPFDVATCSAALWRCFELEGIQSRESCPSEFEHLSPVKKRKLSVPQAPADTIYIKGTLPLHQHRAPDVELDIRGVMKRFVDRDGKRVLFVWESVIECPSKMLNYAAKDAEVRDFGWGVLESVPGSVPGDDSTIVQLCSYIAPRVGGGSLAEECRQHVHSLADLVVPSFRDVWGKRQRVLENLLMDSAVSSQSGGARTPSSTAGVQHEVVKAEHPPM